MPQWVLISNGNFVAIFLDAAIERLILKSVVAGGEWEIRTSVSHFCLELHQVTPQNEESLFELVTFTFVFSKAENMLVLILRKIQVFVLGGILVEKTLAYIVGYNDTQLF